ncbi:MAG TPA: aminoacyl-tRNA hydrolase, partial [bacterium]|nr:aminoacyl-tRNA hydrolase [bacterium]
MKEQKIIVGLGNSPLKFNGTRHNFGFDVIDSFCEKYDLKYDQLGPSCQLAKTRKSGYLRNKLQNHAVLARPITYMNTSGPKIMNLLDKLEAKVEDMLVIYDDIDLNLGRLRFRPHGSAGGHRGIKSIINSLGT